jgi:hypothetical protein
MSELKQAYMYFQLATLFPPELQFSLRDIHISESALLGNRMFASYASTVTPRQVRIYYSPPQPGKIACFTVFIDEGNGESFILAEYLEKRQLAQVAQTFCNGAALPQEQFLDNFARVLYHLSETELAPILSGKVWGIEPFDWAPYR